MMLDLFDGLGSIALANWLLTYLIYSTAIFLIIRVFFLRKRFNASIKDFLLKFALVGSLIASILHVLISSIEMPDRGKEFPVSQAALQVDSSDFRESAPGYNDLSFGLDTIGSAVENITSKKDVQKNTTNVGNPALVPDVKFNIQKSLIHKSWLILPVWGLIATILIFRFARRKYVFLKSLGPTKEINDGEILLIVEQVQDAFKISGKVRLLMAKNLISPIALSDNRIVLPEIAFLSPEKNHVTSMIAHEMAHLKRRDPIWLMLSNMLNAIFFFHPIVRWNTQLLQNNTEVLCDLMAIQVTGDRKAMADCLLTVAHWMNENDYYRLVPGMAFKRSLLKHRIQNIINSKNMKNSIKQYHYPLLVIFALGALSSFILPGVSLVESNFENSSMIPTVTNVGTPGLSEKEEEPIKKDTNNTTPDSDKDGSVGNQITRMLVSDGLIKSDDSFTFHYQLDENRIWINQKEIRHFDESYGNLIKDFIQKEELGREGYNTFVVSQQVDAQNKREGRFGLTNDPGSTNIDDDSKSTDTPGSKTYPQSKRNNYKDKDMAILKSLKGDGYISAIDRSQPYLFVYEFGTDEIIVNNEPILEQHYQKYKKLVERRVPNDERKSDNIYILIYKSRYKTIGNIGFHGIISIDNDQSKSKSFENRGKKFSGLVFDRQSRDQEIMRMMVDDGHIQHVDTDEPYLFLFEFKTQDIIINKKVLERNQRYKEYYKVVEERIADFKKDHRFQKNQDNIYVLVNKMSYKDYDLHNHKIHAVGSFTKVADRVTSNRAQGQEGAGDHALTSGFAGNIERNAQKRKAFQLKALTYYSEDLQFDGNDEESETMLKQLDIAAKSLRRARSRREITEEEFMSSIDVLFYENLINLGTTAIEMKILQTMIDDGHITSFEVPHLFEYHFTSKKVVINNQEISGDSAAKYKQLVKQRALKRTNGIFVLLKDMDFNSKSKLRGGTLRGFIN